jgi:hypothetical protein
VNRTIFKRLPDVKLVPLHGNRAFLALRPEHGLGDLELAIVDRLDDPISDRRQHEALVRLRRQLRKWRRESALAFEQRTLIVARHLKPRRRQ